MPERTDQPPEQPSPATLDALDVELRRILRDGTYAAQLLRSVADELDQVPYLTVNADELAMAIAVAHDVLFFDMPPLLAEEAAERASAVMPDIHDDGRQTCGEYATLLRLAARTV
ncbi:hypothetical protein ABT160_02595 [Streptomyces sp. NPDC001941]|uniref:hypothetical protein n=1 Tax=Streptomyces sp. NPDC001941 TaxID=3154659 RepID=UPI00332AF3DC